MEGKKQAGYGEEKGVVLKRGLLAWSVGFYAGIMLFVIVL